MESRISYWKFAVVLIAIVAVAAGGYFIWDRYFSEAGLMRRQAALYEKAEKEYIAAMTADTYGGKTPQETLDMFVAALRAGDIELASKYFLLDTDSSIENINNYLTTNNYREALLKAQKENRLIEIANVVSRALPNSNQPDWDENQRWYLVYDDKGEIVADITMRFNKHSSVWKIENL